MLALRKGGGGGKGGQTVSERGNIQCQVGIFGDNLIFLIVSCWS